MILPALVIILLIAAILKNLLKYKGVQGFLSGVRPAVAALILATAVTMGLKSVFNVSGNTSFSFDYKALVILAFLALTALFAKYIIKKKLSPIFLIVLSAGLGMLFYGVL